MLSDRLATGLGRIDVVKEPRRMAQGATLLERVQEHEAATARLEAQVTAFLSERAPETEPARHRSLADWAAEVLADNAKPMPYREIGEEIRRRGFRHVRPPKSPDQIFDSVWTAMYEDARFVKVGRSVWGLADRDAGE